jgi:CheY-like chemotaxis protein
MRRLGHGVFVHALHSDGSVDLEALLRQHKPTVIVYDIAPPYVRNWRFFEHLRETILKGHVFGAVREAAHPRSQIKDSSSVIAIWMRPRGTSVAGRSSVSVSRGAHVVLILEDNDENRTFLRLLFESEGYRVATAANGADALNWLNHHPPPSVIMLDLNMPVMNGWEFCAALDAQTRLARIPVVVLSAEAEGGRNARQLPAPVTYLEKPAIPEVLVRTVTNEIRVGRRAR